MVTLMTFNVVDVEGADVVGPAVEHRVHVVVLDVRQVVEPLVAAGVVRVDDPHSPAAAIHTVTASSSPPLP